MEYSNMMGLVQGAQIGGMPKYDQHRLIKRVMGNEAIWYVIQGKWTRYVVNGEWSDISSYTNEQGARDALQRLKNNEIVKEEVIG